MVNSNYLPQFLRNVERPALRPLLALLVVEAEVVVDEVDLQICKIEDRIAHPIIDRCPCLQQLRHLDGDVEGERDDDLEDDDERPEGEEAVPARLDRLVAQLVPEGRVPETELNFIN